MGYIKTQIGEHDYHKPDCSRFCKMGGEFCPFVKAERTNVGRIVRWTDIADRQKDLLLGNPIESQDVGYTADFSGKQVLQLEHDDSLATQNLEEELYQAGYTCWGDGSGFEYDKMSNNVMGPDNSMENVYDITRYGVEHEALQLSRWNAWVDKIQYDYRFGRVSDTNAECVLFPNVDNPWMFTEYVFKGIGGDEGKCALTIPKEYVVEPPIYDPTTLALVNGDSVVRRATDYDGKYAADCNESSLIENMGFSVRQYRKITNWDELTTWTLDEAGGDALKLAKLNEGNVPLNVNDSGIKLYKARIPVQSVKWGEHGNIPPHTLDMTAPASWMNPANVVTKLKAVYDAVIGTTKDCPYDGKIEWDGNQAYVWTNMTIGNAVSEGGHVSYYPYSGGTRVELDMPSEMVRGETKALKPTQKLMPDDSRGEFCHAGCGNLIGINGKFYCKLIRNGNLSYASNFNPENCLNSGGYGGASGCGSYVSLSQRPVIASYQEKKVGVDQMSSDLGSAAAAGMMMGAVGGVSGALVGAGTTATMIGGQMDKIAQYYTNLGKRGDVQVSYVVRYEPVMASDAKAQLNMTKYNEFGKGVQIVPGTGKYALESEENSNPFSGGDTNAYGDISTISFHRFFTSVMHCADHRYCNEIMGKAHEQGFSYSSRAGGADGCRYHKEWINGVEGCPYNCAPKRAIEFANCASGISSRVMQFMGLYNSNASYYVWDFEPGEYTVETLGMYEKATVGTLDWRVFGSYAVCQLTDNVALLAVKFDNGGEAVSGNVDYSWLWSGAALLSQVPNHPNSIPNGFLLFGEFRTGMELVDVDFNGERKQCKLYNATDAFYWFQPLDNDGNPLSYEANAPMNLRQHVDENGYWFCKAESVPVPQTNCMLVDNGDKFIGGWHPEYKDYSKIGGEFMQDIVSDVSREGQGVGDYVQGQDYSPIPQPVNKKGYWIDESGVYITDERSIGAGEPILQDDERESNGGPGACLSFKKTNTEIDGETGQQIQPKVVNAALCANDPYDFVVNKLLKEGRPKFTDPDTDEEYSASPYVGNRLLLPTLRHALHCPNCDYYIPFKYHDTGNCPWCGGEYEVITGDAGVGMVEGDTWDDDASIMRKFFKIYSIGNADVWCPPGTALKTDAYFWKRQSQITNGLRKQIVHRLGDSNKKGDGGSYKFNRMSATSEMTLGYPEMVGDFIAVPKGVNDDRNTTMRYGKNYIDWKPEEDTSVDGMYNPVSPRHMLPEFYGKSDEGEEDEGVIAPYTNSSNDALKLVSYEQMRVFRNGIEPIYAYVLEDYAYERDYPTYRASYDQREIQDQPIIWEGRRSVISPQVLASTDDGRDTYQTYFSGDLVYGNVKEYFPSGYTWWMLKGVIGGRCTENKGGYYHLDDGGKYGNGRMEGGSGGEYTCGKRTVAKCALSIYGMLPLDKEILKAYVIIRPSGVDPSKDPVGRSWTGGPVMYCHYHALPKSHYEDGMQRHLHGTAGYPQGEYFDEDGNFVDTNPGTIYYASDDIRYQDESAYRLWGHESNAIDDDRGLFYDNRVSDTMTNIPCLYDVAFHRHVGTVKIPVSAYNSSERLGYGYDKDSFGEIAGFEIHNLSNTDAKREQKYQYVVVDDENMLVIKYPDAVVWKTDSSETIEKTIENHMATVEIKVSDGTTESVKTYTFRQADSELYGNQMPRQSQEITGYFDMSWTNTKGYVYDEYSVQKSRGGVDWNAAVVFQGDEPVANSDYEINGYSGGGESGQIGPVARCVDITDIVKKLYNKRIDRTFSCDAGCTIQEILEWAFYGTMIDSDTLEKLDDDVALQNSRTDVQSDGTYLLTDSHTYPKLEGDDVPLIDQDGDKYELAEKKAVLSIETSPLMVVDSSCDAYSFMINGNPVSGRLANGTYAGITDEFLDMLKGIFGADSIVRNSLHKATVTSENEIRVLDCEDNCYGLLGISTGVVEPVQSRVVDMTNCADGYSADTLMGEGSGLWTYDTYNTSFQSFTVDLLRAPLCKSQKDWRYQEPTDEAPGDGIMTYEYDAPFSPNPYITKIIVKPHTTYPTSYRVFVRADGFRSWRSVANVVYNSGLSGGYELLYCIDENASVGMDGGLTISIRAGELRARYAKVECDSEMQNSLHQYPIRDSNGDGGYQVIAEGEFSKMGMLTLEGTKAIITNTQESDPFANPFADTYEIVAAQTIGEDNGKLRISLNRMAYDPDASIQTLPTTVAGKYISFHAMKQVGGISEFKVYGFHYKTEESDGVESDYESGKKYLTVTGMEDEFCWRLGTQTTNYEMPDMPTQILEVSAGRSGSAGVVLTEAGDGEPLFWTTVNDKVLSMEYNANKELVTVEHAFRRIVGGNYRYDIMEGKIYIPRYDQTGVPWEQFESSFKNTSVMRTYLPDTLTMRYWSGNGRDITFKVKADGHGPSYMVEKNAIQEMTAATEANLPNNGVSCKILGLDGDTVSGVPIPWICYNNRPASLSIEDQSRSNSIQGTVKFSAGEFRKPPFSGKEIGGSMDDDGAFVKLFGEHCEGCRGQCETEVTLTGAPNQIVSGHLVFVARAVTKRTVDAGNGKKIHYEERTGGIDQGIIVVSCSPTDAAGGRMTLCYSVPELLIYAKESKLFSETE